MNDETQKPGDLGAAPNGENTPLPSEDGPPLEQDASTSDEIVAEDNKEPSKSEEGDSNDEKLPPPDKFAFIKNQPIYIKIIASLLFLALLFTLIWFVIPKRTSEIPQKNYRIAMDSSWYPLMLKSREKNMTNFTRMLFSSIATAQGLKLHLYETGPNLFTLLQLKEVDGIISILPPQDLSTERYISSDPIYQLGFVLVVKSNSAIKKPDDIEDKLIGIIGNAQNLMKIAHFPSTIFTNYPNAPIALTDLDNNIIDGVIMEVLEANSYIKGLYAGNFTILYPPLISEGIELYLYKDKEAEKFIKLFDEGLDNMRKNGSYRALIEQWDLIYTEKDKRT